MLVKEVMATVGIGIFLGLVLALIAAPFIGSLLFGVPAWDPITLLSVSGLLVFMSILASWFPARRAAKIDPMDALRYQ